MNYKVLANYSLIVCLVIIIILFGFGDSLEKTVSHVLQYIVFLLGVVLIPVLLFLNSQ